MKRILLGVAAAGLLAPFAIGGAALADGGGKWKDQWKIRAECDRKLARARSPWEFQKKAAECNEKLAKFHFKQREEAIKSWRKAEEKWRERHREWAGDYYDWDDDDD